MKAFSIQYNQFYWILSFMFIGNKLLVYFFVNTIYVDQDQLTMYLSAKEMIAGNFYEPNFWGQSYNSMMESFFAVPLLYIGMPVQYAVPFVTMFMGVFPFLFGSNVLYRKVDKKLGIILLFIGIITTVYFDILCGMPRGFVTGIFCVSFAFFSLANQKSKLGWFIFGFVSVLGMWLNPNSLFLSFLIGYWLMVKNYSNFKFYFIMGLGTIIPIFWIYYSRQFYLEHPEFNFHGEPSLGLAIQNFTINISSLDKFFRHVAPLARFFGWICFVLFPVGIFFLFIKKKKIEGILFVLLFLLMLFSLFFEKLVDSQMTVFLSGGRFFMTFPLLLAFLIYYLLPQQVKLPIKFLTIIVFLVFIFKIFIIVTEYSNIDRVGKLHWVSVDSLENIKKECEKEYEIAKKEKVTLIVYRNDPDQLLNYGCPCFIEDFPKTVFTWYERRTWVLKELDTIININIMLVRPNVLNSSGKPLNELSSFSREYVILNHIIVSPNQLLDSLGYNIRRH